MSNISDINSSKPLKNLNKSPSDKKEVSSQKNPPVNQGDTVSISENKKQISAEESEKAKVQNWATQAMNLKDDSSGVDRARQRLESGYYNDPAVLKEVLEKIGEEILSQEIERDV